MNDIIMPLAITLARARMLNRTTLRRLKACLGSKRVCYCYDEICMLTLSFGSFKQRLARAVAKIISNLLA